MSESESRGPLSDQSDFDLMMAQVQAGTLGAANLAQLLLAEREAHHATGLEVKHWQVLYNAALALNLEHEPGMLSTDATDLVELILWLALPWGDNDPLFPESDGWTPRALEANVRMRATWQRVVRNLATPTGAVPVIDVDEKGGAHGSE